MAKQYNQIGNAGSARFSRAPMAEVEYSKLSSAPYTYTSHNAGELVPLRVVEMLPHTTYSCGMDFINRLTSPLLKPIMGNFTVDYFAYFVANEVVNDSWKNIQGENTSGFWTAPEITLAPLVPPTRSGSTKIPVGSVADYYGLPTQRPIKNSVLSQMSDTIFRGYCSIWNNDFRSENYQELAIFSKLNVYQGFLDPLPTMINMTGASSANTNVSALVDGNGADGSYPDGAIIKGLYGEGNISLNGGITIPGRLTNFSALERPLPVNKFHDVFTSVLPSPSKGPDVYLSIGDVAPIDTAGEVVQFNNDLRLWLDDDSSSTDVIDYDLRMHKASGFENGGYVFAQEGSLTTSTDERNRVVGSNLVADLSKATGISLEDLRLSLAIKHVYESLSRSGSRYNEILANLFEIDNLDVWHDRPVLLGQVRRELDFFQVAQTSASQSNSTAQGDLAAFGYTNSQGNDFFTYTAPAHGYLHILCCVRQANIYPAFIAPTWFRRNTLDWYFPDLANISEQPVRLALLNPFETYAGNNMESVIGYQEAWWDYRHDVDMVTGMLRSGIVDETRPAIDIWVNSDLFDPTFSHVNGDWLKSNAREVLDKSLAVTSDTVDQFITGTRFRFTKNLPMPTYSMPGLDVV